MLIGPICVYDRCGYVDETGKLCIPLEFDEMGSFSEGLAWFVKDEKVGFVNERGEIAISPAFDRGKRLGVISDFRCGLASVCLGEKEGYIDRGGTFQIPCQFDTCSPFVGEIALVGEDHCVSVIDRSGKKICRLPFEDVAEAPYESNLIKVYPRIERNVAPAFINSNGMVVGGPFRELEDIFCFGKNTPSYAIARCRKNGLVGFLGKEWRVEIPFRFGNALNFSEDLAAASTPEYLWGYIDPRGSWIISPEYTDAHQFYNGTASVRKGRGKFEKWIVIDKQNHQISPEVYDRVVDFENGFRCVWKGNATMVIDHKCNVIWNCQS